MVESAWTVWKTMQEPIYSNFCECSCFCGDFSCEGSSLTIRKTLRKVWRNRPGESPVRSVKDHSIHINCTNCPDVSYHPRGSRWIQICSIRNWGLSELFQNHTSFSRVLKCMLKLYFAQIEVFLHGFLLFVRINRNSHVQGILLASSLWRKPVGSSDHSQLSGSDRAAQGLFLHFSKTEKREADTWQQERFPGEPQGFDRRQRLQGGSRWQMLKGSAGMMARSFWANKNARLITAYCAAFCSYEFVRQGTNE